MLGVGLLFYFEYIFCFCRFLSLKFLEKVKDNGVRFWWWQLLYGGYFMGDWFIDNVCIGGEDSNLIEFMLDFSGLFDYQSWMRDDNVVGDLIYCNEVYVVYGII